MTTAKELRRDIGRTISQAMKAVDVDWSRESPAITETFEVMQETMALYAEGNASKNDVKKSYKAWVDAHRGGLFG